MNNNNNHNIHNVSSKSLFNFNDSYSWTNHECNCNGTLPDSGINDNIVMLPPYAQTDKLIDINLPASHNGLKHDASHPVVGVVNRPFFNKAPISLANHGPNVASFQMVDALGSLSQSDLTGHAVVPSNTELKVHTAISQISKEAGSKVEAVKEATKEQVNKEIVKSIQESTVKVVQEELNKRPAPEVHPEVKKEQVKQLSEHVGSAVAAKVETSLKPATSMSLNEVESIAKQHVSTVLKEVGISHAESNQHAETVANKAVSEIKSAVTAPVSAPASAPSAPAPVTTSPQINNAIAESAKQISAAVTSNAKGETKVPINEVVKVALAENLTKPLAASIGPTIQKSVDTTANSGTLVTLQVNKPAAVGEFNNAITSSIAKSVVEKFTEDFAEHFAEGFDENELNETYSNMFDMISSHLFETFDDAAFTALYNESNYSTQNTIENMDDLPPESEEIHIEHMDESLDEEHMDASVPSASSSAVVKASSEVVKQQNSNIVTAEVCTNCDLNKSSTAEAIAATVAKTLAPASVTNVAVLTNPNSNSKNVIVSAEVPPHIDTKQVAKAMVHTVNKAAKAHHRRRGPDTFTTLIILSLVGFLFYKLYLKR